MDALRTISQTRKGAKKLSELGGSALISGCVQTSLFAFPLGAVQFTVFGGVKKAISSVVGDVSGGVKGTAVAMASASCASLASCAVGVPQEVLKQRLVTKIYPNFSTAVKTILKTEGLKGFYTGWAPTVARNLPYVVTTFTCFNHWKSQVRVSYEAIVPHEQLPLTPRPRSWRRRRTPASIRRRRSSLAWERL